MKEIIDTFQMHSCINIYLLEAIGELHLDDLTSSNRRNAGEHNIPHIIKAILISGG